MKRLFSFLFSMAVLAQAYGVTTREVSYQAGSVTAKGFLAIPEGAGKHPAVLVVHEFWGLNDYARKRATMLAELGYVALAVDMYGDGKTATHPKDATAFSNAVTSNMPEERSRFEAALKFLQQQPEVDSGKIAAIGYCFGGGVVLQMACDGIPGLAAVASFHGTLDAKIPDGVKPTAKVLVCHGADDAFISPEAVASFKERMKAAGVALTFESYPGALHGFTNPDATKRAQEFGMPIGYNAEADTKSWATLQQFLKTSLQ